jgi:quercetin dioxygenase-like cupin family protein
MKHRQEFALAGVRMKMHLSQEETGGYFSLFENRSNGATRTPIHIHAHEDETLLVLEGTMRAIVDGREQLVGAGESASLSRGVAHQLMNATGSSAHYLLLCTPGGFEHFLEEGGRAIAPNDSVGPPTVEDIERLKTAAPKFGITLLQDWPTPKE